MFSNTAEQNGTSTTTAITNAGNAEFTGLGIYKLLEFKDVYVDLKTGSSGSSMVTLTKSDPLVSNFLLRSTSDFKTGF